MTTDKQPNRQTGNRFSESHFSDLIRLARDGDRSATGELISEYRNYLLLIANDGLDRRLQAKLGPSDVVQQTMMAAQDKLDHFRGESEAEFRAWLRQILKNDLHDSNRKFKDAQRRQINLETRFDDSRLGLPEPVDQFHTPRTDALINEQSELLKLAMATLSEQHRIVLNLRNWQELPFGEIGAQMECSSDAARKLWYRAVVKLQEAFNRMNPQMNSSLIDSMIVEPDKDEA